MPIRQRDVALYKPNSIFDRINDAVASTPVPRHLDRLVAENSSGQGRPGRPRQHARYPAQALLVGLILLAWERRPMTLAELQGLFWETLTPEQTTKLGLDQVLTPERRQRHGTLLGQRREYNRLHRDFDTMCDLLDPSPFRKHRPEHKLRPLTVRQRHDIHRASLQDAELQKRNQRLHWAMNTLLGAFLGNRPEEYDGGLVGDATIVEAAAGIAGTGYKNLDLKYGHDLDATWHDPSKIDPNVNEPTRLARAGRLTPAKTAAKRPTTGTSRRHGDKPAGTARTRRRGPVWGFAVHLTQRIHTLYGPEVAKVATGIAITRACGGDNRAALIAARAHVTNGQGPRPGQIADAIFDMGYTRYDGLDAGLHELRYRVVRDYPKNANPVLHTDTRSGVLIWQGAELCPGAASYVSGYQHSKTWLRQPDHKAPAYAHKAHDAAMNTILAFRLATNGTLRYAPLNAATIASRQQTGKPTGPYIASRGCPARDGRVACPLYQPSMTRDRPAVTHPPAKDAFPICGEKSYTDIRYDEKTLKSLNAYPVGTEDHAARYGGGRARNESYHANLQAPETGNLRPELFDLRGLARVGLIVTACAIVTNIRNLTAHDNTVQANGGQAPLEDRAGQRAARRAWLASNGDRRRTARPLHQHDVPETASSGSTDWIRLGDRRRRRT